MSKVILNKNDIEIFYLKNKRVFVTLFILSILLFLFLAGWILYSFGFIFNRELSKINYKLPAKYQSTNNSIITNSEIKKVDSNKSITILNSLENSLVVLVNENNEFLALNQLFEKEINFSDSNTLSTLMINSPHFIFLDNQSKKEVYNHIKQDYKDFEIKTNLKTFIYSKEYKEVSDSIVKQNKFKDIVTNEYKKIYKKSLPGFADINSNQNFLWTMDDYQDTYPSKFFEKYGLIIFNDSKKPKLNNYSVISHNLVLQKKDSTSLVYNDQNIQPTYLNPTEVLDPKLLEDFQIPVDLDQKDLEYKVFSTQLNKKDLSKSALIKNYSDYLKRLFVFKSKTNSIIDLEFKNQVNDFLKECSNSIDESIQLIKCLNEKVSKSTFESRVQNKSINFADNILLSLYKDLFINLSEIPIIFDKIYTTSPDASFLSVINKPREVEGKIKLKPNLVTKEFNQGKLQFTYDGSYEVVKEELIDKKLTLVLNKQDYFVTITIRPLEVTDFHCTSDLDLIKIENDLYKSQSPKWVNNKLELKNSLIYYKNDSKFIENFKQETKNGLFKVSEAEAKLFKNCFHSDQLETIYRENLLKIVIDKKDDKLLDQDQSQDVDKFIKSIIFEKK
ncbi:MAG: hypothetical protein ACRCXZ_10780 [Patescibacteria group bacterium]